MSRLLLFIPMYNCAPQIGRVFDRIPAALYARTEEVLVVDNRSADGSLAAAEACLRRLPAHVRGTLLLNQENYSLGGSVKVAVQRALHHGFDHLAVLHGDDQADGADLVPVLSQGLHERHDLCIGARFHPRSTLHGYSLVRRLGNRALNLLCGLVTGRRIHDLIAGLNVYRVRDFEDEAFLRFPDDLTFDAHLLLWSIHRGRSLHYFPITWREEDQVSNARVLRQAATILSLLASYAWGRDRMFARLLARRPATYTTHTVYDRT